MDNPIGKQNQTSTLPTPKKNGGKKHTQSMHASTKKKQEENTEK